eukprot:Polyplicarium_translucidae@DN921_c0_g1_i1.p1
MVITYQPKKEKQEDRHTNPPPDIDSPSILAPLHRFKRGKLGVTDLSSQLWCETQLEFCLRTGKRRETQAMKEGIARHEVLENDDHQVRIVEVSSSEDAIGLKLASSINLMDQLMSVGKAREIWVFAFTHGAFFRGIIDELRIVEGEKGEMQLVLLDTKTRRTQTEPSNPQKRTSAIQLQMYYWMLSELRVRPPIGSDFAAAYQVDFRRPLECEELLSFGVGTLEELYARFIDTAARLPPISTVMEIAYECRGVEFLRSEVPYSDSAFQYAMYDLVKWWRGERPTEHVLISEAWKCKQCDFLEQCPCTPLDPEKKRLVLEVRRDTAALNEFDEACENEQLLIEFDRSLLEASQISPAVEHVEPRQLPSNMCVQTSRTPEEGNDEKSVRVVARRPSLGRRRIPIITASSKVPTSAAFLRTDKNLPDAEDEIELLRQRFASGASSGKRRVSVGRLKPMSPTNLAAAKRMRTDV